MKKLCTFAFILMFVAINLYGQKTPQDVFKTDNIVWYGLDFSEARFIGQFDQAAGIAPATANDMKYSYIPAWNALILSEPNRYDLRKTFRKVNVYNDLKDVEVSNRQINEDKLMSFNPYRFEDAAEVVSSIIGNYGDGERNEGVGLVFIVEYFNRIDQEAAVYVTFFDIATQEVLFKERMLGSPRGIGLRNYWAGAIRNILLDIERQTYRSWQNTYGQ